MRDVFEKYRKSYDSKMMELLNFDTHLKHQRMNFVSKGHYNLIHISYIAFRYVYSIIYESQVEKRGRNVMPGIMSKFYSQTAPLYTVQF